MGIFSGIEDMLSSGRAASGQQAQYGAELTAAQGVTPDIQANTAQTTGNYAWAPGALSTAQTGLNSMINGDYTNGTANQYQLQTDPSQYVNPALAAETSNATRAGDSSAAASGGLFSTGHNAATQTTAANMASNAYNSGLTEMNQQNTLGSQNYENILNNSLQRQQLRGNLMQTNLANASNGLGSLTTQENQGTAALVGNKMDIGNLTGQQSAAAAEAPSWYDYVLGGLGGAESAGESAANSYMNGAGKASGLAAVGG